MSNKLFVVMTVLLAFALIAGCGGKEPTEGQEEETAAKSETSEAAETEEVAASEDTAETTEQQEAEQQQSTGEEAAAEAEKDTYTRPAEFPADALRAMSEFVSTGDTMLSEEKVLALKQVYERAAEFEGAEKEEVTALLEEIGFSSVDAYVRANTSALLALDTINALNVIQNIIESTGQEQKAAENFQIDDAMKSMARQLLTAGKLTEEDLHYTYDNWGTFVELKKMSEEQ
jgi:predicted small lipoprotein YifL